MKSFKDNTSIILAALSLTLGCGLTQVAHAEENNVPDGDSSLHGGHGGQHHRKEKKAFMLGLCVGGALEKEGVVLPPRVPGKKPTLDDATKAKFKAAIDACRAEHKKHDSEDSDDNSSEDA